ncbi:MAG: hypothetical protein NTX42_06470 [Methanothrix sp.]|nr:hypothetical protein [Methanothrix sp.]
MSKNRHEVKPSQYKFVSSNSPEYRLEFVNGALSNVTPRGEIVCDFHFESKDRPVEQIAILVEDGKAKLSDLQDTGTFTRDVKFGIVINVPFAKDLITMLNKKIEECEEVIAERAATGDHK